MNAKGQEDPGEDRASSRVGAESPCNDMKRAAAKKLIERYFYQLTDGCGNSNCDNQHCASSGKLPNLTANEAAAQAVLLFAQDARLCDGVQPSKVARTTLEPGPASVAKSLPSKNVNPACSVEEVEAINNTMPEEPNAVDSIVDYSSETDDRSIILDFIKPLDQNLSDADKSKDKQRKKSSISKKKSKRKHASSHNNSKTSNSNDNSLVHKLIVLALYLRYVDAKNIIRDSRAK